MDICRHHFSLAHIILQCLDKEIARLVGRAAQYSSRITHITAILHKRFMPDLLHFMSLHLSGRVKLLCQFFHRWLFFSSTNEMVHYAILKRLRILVSSICLRIALVFLSSRKLYQATEWHPGMTQIISNFQKKIKPMGSNHYMRQHKHQ